MSVRGTAAVVFLLAVLLSGCGVTEGTAAGIGAEDAVGTEAGVTEGTAGTVTDSAADSPAKTELRWAERFQVEYDEAGRALVTIAGTDRFLLVPRGLLDSMQDSRAADTQDGISNSLQEYMADNPQNSGVDAEELPEGVTVLEVPLERIYVAASSSLDFFQRLDALDAVGFTSTSLSNWSLEPVQAAMERGGLLYAGKYSAPDFELLLSQGCTLAVESTMITHSPDIREQLEALGIPVLVERSSYEPHPLGRMEWIKLYGLLTGRGAEAAAFFDRQEAEAIRIVSEEDTGKTAAFFSVTPSGAVSIRKPGDYVTKMMEMAGGHSVFSGLFPETDSALSGMNIQMEAFYAAAKDADVLIYNGTIDGGVDTLAQLLGKSGLFREFRAVEDGQVWCTEQNLFQEPTAAADMIADFHAVFTGTEAEQLTYLRRLH